MSKVPWRTSVLAKHFSTSPQDELPTICSLQRNSCLEYCAPEDPVVSSLPSGCPVFDISLMRRLIDGHDVELRDTMFNLMASSELFHLKTVSGKVYVAPDYNTTMEQQRDATMKRIFFLHERGVFKNWFGDNSLERALSKAATIEVAGIFDHSLAIKLGVHLNLWGGAIQFLGTQRHHEKWLQATEDFAVKGCFAMSELGHGSNVRGIETVATYDASTQEFIIDTPCESSQKYWIGGAANDATHTVAFAQLHVAGRNEGVHAFIVQIRDGNGVCPGIRIADCGHKIGLNGVDNGRIWFDKKRFPRENLLNSVAEVSPDGIYISSIRDPDHRFGAFMAPLTYGRIIIAVSSVYTAKLGLATAIRYALTRRAFSVARGEPEVLLLDYPSHQRRLLPLLATTYATSFAANELKMLYVRRKNADAKTIHVLSSGYKAMFSWHNIRTLQECREACGGQGLKTDNRIGQLKAEFDVQLTFEGDNSVLMQQVSKALVADYLHSQKTGKPMKGLGLEHISLPCPVISPIVDSNGLRDAKFQIALFRLRERNLVQHLSEQVAHQLSKGLSLTDALSMNYQLAEDLGRAFSERSVLESFIVAEAGQSISSIKETLGLLRSLYALTIVDEQIVFLRYSYLTPQQSQAIHGEVTKLCAEIRPVALPLVDSFGIPQMFLGPIASDWIEYNSWANVQS
eukprot:c19319_g1_i1 orf=197-2248(+)